MKHLETFKALLLERKKNLLEILDSKSQNIKSLHQSALKDESDLVSAHLQGHMDSLMIEKYALELQEVESSLQKIQKGVYGICEMCDDEINIERLKIKPHARFCIKCREIYEKDKASAAK